METYILTHILTHPSLVDGEIVAENPVEAVIKATEGLDIVALYCEVEDEDGNSTAVYWTADDTFIVAMGCDFMDVVSADSKEEAADSVVEDIERPTWRSKVYPVDVLTTDDEVIDVDRFERIDVVLDPDEPTCDRTSYRQPEHKWKHIGSNGAECSICGMHRIYFDDIQTEGIPMITLYTPVGGAE